MRFRLTAGQAHALPPAPELIKEFKCDYVIADKGYDSDAFVAQIAAQGAMAVIAKRTHPRTYDE